MAKYSLVGQDGNAYALMGYTARALKREGLRDKATSGDYYNLIAVCDDYVGMANEAAVANGYVDDDDEEDY